MPQPILCQEAPFRDESPGFVTEETLEAKIAEAEAATGIEEQAKTALVGLYSKALGNLRVASSSVQAAANYQ
ncbi:MAG: hypothetical protein WBG92_05660 [Thiohalocapsa sp.]